MRPKRVKILRISPELLVALLSMDGGKRVKIEGMPPDARIVNVSDQRYFDTGLIAFMVESDTFPEVEDGGAISLLELTCTEIPEESGRGRQFI